MDSSLPLTNPPDILDTIPFEEIFTQTLNLQHIEHEHRAVVLRRADFSTRLNTESNTLFLAPIHLSQVCSKWRQIALVTPDLWTYIYLCEGQVRGLNPPRWMIDQANIRLERLQSKPLFIELYIWGHHQDLAIRDEMYRCIVSIFSNRGRWKSAVLDFNLSLLELPEWGELQRELMRASRERNDDGNVNGTPMLDYLDLIVTPGSNHDEDEDDTDLLPSKLWTISSPSLRRLALSLDLMSNTDEFPEFSDARQYVSEDRPDWGYDYRYWASRHNIPYSQITHLLLEVRHYTEVLAWEDIGIEGEPDFIPNTGAIVLVHLLHLYLESGRDDTDPFSPPLNTILTAPALKTLVFANASDWSYDAYAEFVTCSCCKLEYLRFMETDIDLDTFLKCMRHTPSLQCMHLDGGEERNFLNSEFVRAMTAWDDATAGFVLVPKLRQLSMFSHPAMYHEHSTDVDDLLVEVLKTRLCPPDGNKGPFTTLSLLRRGDRDYNKNLQMLKGEPWYLRVVHNDEEVTSHGLLYRYGGSTSPQKEGLDIISNLGCACFQSDCSQ